MDVPMRTHMRMTSRSERDVRTGSLDHRSRTLRAHALSHRHTPWPLAGNPPPACYETPVPRGHALMAVILWWLLLEGLGLLALPLTFPLFGPRTAHGYPFAKIVALLVLTYVAWLLGFVIPLGTALTATLVGLVAVSLGAGVRAARRRSATGCAAAGWRELVRHDGLWTVGFLFFVFQRWMAPDIFGAEKYMDFAFLNGLLRADAHAAARPVDERRHDQLLLLRLPDVRQPDAAGAAAGDRELQPLRRHRRRPRLLADRGGRPRHRPSAGASRCSAAACRPSSATSTASGNSSQKGTLRGMDYWRSSRVVAKGDTINEFPFFSTIHGDLHPHFMVLPVGILLLGILLDERLFPSRAEALPQNPWRAVVPFALVTFVLGAMVAISNWELPMGVLVVALLAGRWQPLSPLFSRARLQLALRAGRRADRRVRPLHAVLPPLRPAAGAAGPERAVHRLGLLHRRQDLAARVPHRLRPAALPARRAGRRARLGAGCPSGGGEGRHLAIAAAGLAIVFAAIAGNAVLPLLALLLGGALVVAYWGSDGEERAGYPAHRRRRRGAARLRGRVPQGLVRREALPHEHRLQALLPGLDHPRRSPRRGRSGVCSRSAGAGRRCRR